MKLLQVTIILFLLCISIQVSEQGISDTFWRFARLQRSPEPSSSIQIVGGQEAQPHQFPYVVAIHVRNYEGGYDHHCGGAIYDDTHVITAAHCVGGIHPNNLKVIAGEHEIFKDDGTEQYRDVLHYIYHPNYDLMTKDNDIAIITLDWPLDLNSNIRPIKVPLRKIENPPTGRTTGWGSDGVADGFQPKLLYVDLEIFSRERCREAFKGVAEITEGMMCAGNEGGGKGSCRGDSGGPFTIVNEEGEEYLRGVVSWGMLFCATPQHPSVFTDINNYVDWLRDKLPQAQA